MVVSSWQIIFSTTWVDSNGVDIGDSLSLHCRRDPLDLRLESRDILFGPRHSRRRSFIRSTQVGTLRDHRDRFDRSIGVVNAIDKAGAKLVHG
jgi:hypothetical protein